MTARDGTEQAIWLLLPPDSNTAAPSQQYCWLEAAIANQPLLYREALTSVPPSIHSCTANQPTSKSEIS